MKKSVLIGGAVIILGLFFVLYKMSYTPSIKDTTVSVGTMRFEIVTTAEAQERGLGGRSSIPSNYGMLFVFNTPDRYGFWMKDMLVPIDIIWLTKEGRVVAVDASISPATYPKPFYPPTPVSYVLETRAGFASEKGWGIGSTISLPPPYGN